MKKYIVFVLFLSAFTALQAQDLYPEKFSDCHQTRFSFCLDCGDPKASYDGDLVGYFNSVFKKSARKMSGKAFVQVIIDSAGHQCVKSLQHDAGVDVRKLRLKDEINAMTGWHAAVKKGKPVSSSRVMVFSFADCDLSISFRDFDSKNTKNMLSVGKVEISDPSKYKNNLNDKLFHVYTTQNSKVPWDMSRSVSIDQDGTVFQGTDNGIVQVKDGVMTVINQGNSGLRGSNADGGRTTTVMASAVDAQNNKWFSGGYAVYRYDGAAWQVYDSLNSPVRWQTGIYADAAGSVYFEGFHGLVQYDGKVWTTLTKDNSKLPSDRVMGIFVDSRKRLWVGTDKGTVRFDGAVVENFQGTDNPLKQAAITKGYEDKDGTLWFALYEKKNPVNAMAKLSKDGVWTVINTENAMIPNNSVQDFVVDEVRQVLWLSVHNVGLCRFDGKTWGTFTPENSKVPSTVVEDLALDAGGRLWCATFAGLLRIDPAE